MSIHMVQNPEICAYTGMQRIKKFEHAIGQGKAKRVCVLMMMIPGTDLRLGNNRRVEIKTQNIGIIHQKIEAEIQCAQGQDEGDRYPVRGMFKHL